MQKKRKEKKRRVCNKRAKVKTERERERSEAWRGEVGFGKFQSGVELAETGKKRLCLFTGNNVALF